MDLREATDVFWEGCTPGARHTARFGEAYEVVRTYVRARVARYAEHCVLGASEDELDDLTGKVVVKLIRRARAIPAPDYPKAYWSTAAKRVVFDTPRLPPTEPVDGSEEGGPDGGEGFPSSVALEALLDECQVALGGWLDDRVGERNAASGGSGDRMRQALEVLAARKAGAPGPDPTESAMRSMRRHREWVLSHAWESAATSHARAGFYRASFGDLPVFDMNGAGDDRSEPRLKRLGSCQGFEEQHDRPAGLLLAVRVWEESGARVDVTDASLACATFDVFRLALVKRYAIHDGRTARAAAAKVSASARADRPVGQRTP